MEKKGIGIFFHIVLFLLFAVLIYTLVMRMVVDRDVQYWVYCILMMLIGVNTFIGASYVKNKWGIFLSDLSVDYVISIPYLFLIWAGNWWLLFGGPIIMLLLYRGRYVLFHQGRERCNVAEVIEAVINMIIMIPFAFCNTYIVCALTGMWP